MKKVLGIFILTLFLFFSGFNSFAQEQLMPSESLSVSVTPTLTPTPTPDYVLPYPGILPDNPLYVLKTLRDRFISFMIGDPLKKAEFDVLQADKRLGAALQLFAKAKKEKEQLGISTISKGQNYFEEALQKTEEAKKQGIGVLDITLKMKRSVQKHVYALKQAKKDVSKENQKSLDDLIIRMQNLQKRVEAISS